MLTPGIESCGGNVRQAGAEDTIQQESWDECFSRDNKAWASEFSILENIVHGIDMNRELIVSSHPAVLDGFIDMFRREVLEQEKDLSARQEKVTSGLCGSRAAAIAQRSDASNAVSLIQL